LGCFEHISLLLLAIVFTADCRPPTTDFFSQLLTLLTREA
jgi:hypothetical protein